MSGHTPGPAFPSDEYNINDGHTDGRYEIHAQHQGMSLRDYFAAAALTGILAQLADTEAACNVATAAARQKVSAASVVADIAYDQADAMLVSRKKVSP